MKKLLYIAFFFSAFMQYVWAQQTTSPTLTVSKPIPINDTTFVIQSDSVDCHGRTTGSITIYPKNLDDQYAGTGLYSYHISGNGITPQTVNNQARDESATFTANGLGAGNYQLVISDGNSCSDTISVAVYEPDPLSINITKENVSCFGEDDAQIEVSVTGGNGNNQYRMNVSPYNGFSTNNNFTSLNPGTYTVYVKDANNCQANQTGIVITQPDELKINSLTATNISCYDSADGSITVNTTGGNGGNTFYWRDINTTDPVFTTSVNKAEDLIPSDYRVYVQDSKGCTSGNAQTTITEPSQLTANPIVTDVTCNGADDGTLNLSNSQISGGTTPYQVWSSGFVTSGFENPDTFTGIAAANYLWSVKDANGCLIHHQPYTINEPDLLTLDHSIDSISCFGDNDGSITLSATGGNGGNSYAYKLSSVSTYIPLTTSEIDNLESNTYDLKVTDSKGCTVEQNTNLTQPDSLKITAIDVTDVLCGESPTGKIALTTTGGNGETTYSWTGHPDSSRNELTNLRGGNYTFDVSDSKSCPSYGIKTATIAEPDPIVATAMPTDISCHSADDGAIELSVTSGGTAPFTYSLQGYSTNSTQTNYTNLAASNYNWSIEDDNGCVYNDQVILSQPDSLQLQIASIDTITCAGENNGIITVTASGGNSGNTYAFGDFNYQTDTIFSNLITGVYKIRLQDSKGCQDSIDYNLTEPDSLKITNVLATDILCGGYPTGSIQLTTTGGNGETSYSWTNYPDSSRNQLTSLSGGNYSFEVTDNKGCSSYGTKSITLTEPDSLEATSLAQNISCHNASNGEISIQAEGGITPYVYSLNASAFHADSLFSDLDTTTYNWTVRDQNGCEVNNQNPIILTQPDSLIVSIANYDSITCYNSQNGSLQLAAIGGTAPYSYAFDNTNYVQDFINYNNLDTGSYVLRLQDQNGCLDSLTTTFSQPDSLQIDSIIATDLLCGEEQNGTLQAYVSGGNQGNTYLWRQYPDSNISYLQNINGGDYHLVVTDRKGCETDTSTAFVYEPSRMQVNTTPEDAKCNGESDGTILLALTGGTGPFIYSIDNGVTFENDSLFENQALGTYNWIVQDNNNCQETGIVEINEPTPLIANLFSTDSALCFGASDGSITLSTQGGTKPYSYSTDAISYQSDSIISNLLAGNYKVYIKDRFNCLDTVQTSIGQPTEITASFENEWVVCKGDASGSSAISISGGSPAYIVSWSSGATGLDANNLLAGSYDISVTDDHLCLKTFQTTIEEAEEAFTVQIIDSANVYCDELQNGFAQASITGGYMPYSYQWNDDELTHDTLTIDSLAEGRYIITATDSLGCQTKDSVYIAVNTPFTIQDINDRDTVVMCANSTFTSDQTQTLAQYYQWERNGLIYTNDPQVDLFLVGDYTITLSDDLGCIETDSFYLDTSSSVIKALFLATNHTVYGDTLRLSEISWPVPETVDWNFGEGIVLDNDLERPVLTFPEDIDSTKITLTVSSGTCVDQYSKTIYFYPEGSVNQQISRLGFRGIEELDIYPNPSTTHFNMLLELTEEEDVDFKIIDASGYTHQVKKLKGQQVYRETVDVSNLSRGVYFLHIATSNDLRVMRFVVY